MRLRQVTIALGTLLGVSAGYLVYVVTLGQLTDMPQLPAEWREPMQVDGSEEFLPPAVRESEVAAVRGFGPACTEMVAPLILESRRSRSKTLPTGRGAGTYVYAETYEIPVENPHQIRLRPFSLVHIGPGEDESGNRDEILTVRSEEAVLEFDRPVDLTRLTNIEPLSGYIKGDVTLKSNRRSVSPNDDIIVFAEKLHYDRGKQMIWADDPVKIVVESKGTITGKGLEVELFSEDTPDELKGKAEARTLKLLRDVRFELILTAAEDFLGGRSPNPDHLESSLNRQVEAKSDVVVSAHGPFTFDVVESVATFDQMVRVLRRNSANAPGGADSVDQLEADSLSIRFSSAKDGTGRESMTVDKAVAVGRQVILLSESQKLQASGTFLEFDSQQKKVSLRGEEEMIAIQNNAVIHAHQLVIEQDEANNPKRLIADGPRGWMELTQPEGPAGAADQQAAGLQVRWQKQLTMERKPDGESVDFNVAGGVELEHDRGALTCQQLRGVLVPVPIPESPNQKRLEPIKMEAEGNVSFHSDEVDVVSETLLMDILNRRPTPGAEPVEPNDLEEDQADPASVRTPDPAPTLPVPAGAPATIVDTGTAKEPRVPLVIKARTVAIVVERQGSDSRPVSAWAEGNVQVSQPPAKPGDRPLEIVGHQLEFRSQPEGDVITIGGTDKSYAEIRSTEMSLSARQRILLDENNNRVDVEGPGFLTMQTSNALTGASSAEPMPVRLDWAQSMTFDGSIAAFLGSVVAKQQDAELRSEKMDVTFDRRLDFRSLRGGEQEQTKPSIDFVDCERDVEIYQRETREGVVLNQTRILAQQLRYDHRQARLTIDGQGNVTIVEPNKPTNPPTPGDDAAPLPYRVTMINFNDRLAGDQSNQTVKFYGHVDIVHTPVADPGKEIDRDALPDDGFTIHSLRAEMASAVDEAGVKYRLFNANEKVRVQARKYWATCGRVSYDERKQLVVFEGERDQPARFHQQSRPGQPPQTFSARSIRLNRLTQEITTDRSEGFNAIDIGGSAGSGPTRR